MIYWTDRGDPPRGNTVNRAPMDKDVAESEILFGGLQEGIGIALDLKGQRMFVPDLRGNVYSANLNGSDKEDDSDRPGQPDRNRLRRSSEVGTAGTDFSL